MVPAPYSVRWTSKLIRRDLKCIAGNCTSKIRGLFSPTSKTRAQAEFEIKAPFDIEGLHEPALTSAPAGSCDSTLFTDAPEANVKASNTLYVLLETKLKELYASRDHDVPHHERWLFRGAWLLMHLATQYCASNPVHDILNAGSSHVDETSLLLDIMRKSTSVLDSRC
ncbi:hypothetical protein C7974DRAFT_386851, partial [Boeremia exigua]|uniref:uncharacterized protein n=1 Tax=Boeremia exigua TaxID=749465 RepID=UPI001E8CAF43